MNQLTMTALAVALTLLVSSLVEADKEDAVKNELKELEGKWELSSRVYECQDKWPGPKDMVFLTIKGDHYALELSRKPAGKGAWRVDPAQTPKTVDVIADDDPFRPKTFSGIYELKGDELRLCYSDPGKARPKDFNSKPGSGCWFEIYRRVKP